MKRLNTSRNSGFKGSDIKNGLSHQQPNKISEGLKKTCTLISGLLRTFQNFSENFRPLVGQTLRNGLFWYQITRFSDHQLFSELLRFSDHQTARLPDSQMSDHQIVSYSQATSHSQTSRQSDYQATGLSDAQSIRLSDILRLLVIFRLPDYQAIRLSLIFQLPDYQYCKITVSQEYQTLRLFRSYYQYWNRS